MPIDTNVKQGSLVELSSWSPVCLSLQAMMFQLCTALGALLGALASLVAAGVAVDVSNTSLADANGGGLLSPEFITTRLLPLAAGGFIYIALVSVIPDLLAAEDEPTRTGGSKAGRRSTFQRFLQAAAELVALIMGVGLMVVITMYE